MAFELGPLRAEHRADVREILVATQSFKDDEIDVALELFDASLAGDPDYEMVGVSRPTTDDPRLSTTDSRLLGFSIFGPTPNTDGTYDLYWIAVHPDGQGSGVGSRLLAGVEHRLVERAGRLLIIETSSRADYAPTRRFYEKYGYVAGAIIRDFYASGDHRVIYRKSLHPSGAPRT